MKILKHNSLWNKRLLETGASLLVMCTVVSNASAQIDKNEGVETKRVFLDNIVVTATKRAKTLQDVPVAVSVLAATDILKSQSQDLQDIQTLVPSLRVEQLASSSQTEYIIRGFGNGANNPGIEGSVGVFIDGVFYARSASVVMDLPTLERVEILRGPQSTLFGKSVSAGAISVTSKLPTFEWEGQGEVTVGNFNQKIAKGSISGPITENVAFRFSGSINERDGLYSNVVDGSAANEKDRFALRGQVLWQPSDTLKLRFVGDYNESEELCCSAVQIQNGPVTQLIGAPAPFGLGGVISDADRPFDRNVAFNTPLNNKLSGGGVSIHADWDFNFATLTAISAYRSQKDDALGDTDYSSADISSTKELLDQETKSIEVRLASNSDGKLDWLLGGYLFKEDVKVDRDIFFGSQTRPLFDVLTQGALGEVEAALSLPTNTFFAQNDGMISDYTLVGESSSIFGQFDYHASERLTLTAGAAYLNDKKKATGLVNVTDVLSNLDLAGIGFLQGFGALTNGMLPTPDNMAANPQATQLATSLSQTVCNDDPQSAPQPPFCNPLLALAPLQFFPNQVNYPDSGNPLDNGRQSDSSTTFLLRAAYELNDYLNLYASYSTGWKAGAVNLSSDSSPPDPVTGLGRFTSPEDVELVELGAKFKFSNGYLNFAVFDQQIDGFQTNVFNGIGFDLANAGKQSVRGFEIDSLYKPVDPLSLTLALTYLDPEYESFIGASCSEFDPENCGSGQLFRDLSGHVPAGISELSLTTSADYNFRLTNSLEGFFRIEYSYESETSIEDNLPSSLRRSVNLVNASLGLDINDNTQLMVWGRNLTEDEYFAQAFPTTTQLGSISGFANAPRTYGITLRHSF